MELDFATVFYWHRGVVRNGREALRAQRDFLVGRCERVRHLRDEGRSPHEITRELPGREDWLSRIIGLHFSMRNLIRARLAAVARSPA